MVSRDAAIAATRFGIGARPGQLAHIAGDPHGWVRTQIGRGAGDLELFTALPSGAEITIELARLRREDS